MIMKNTILKFSAIVLMTSAANAQTVRLVPEDHPTLQDAMKAASPGDIIELAPGTWTDQNIWGLSDDITLRGRPGGNQTVIDGAGYEWSPVVCFGNCRIENLIFRNGNGSNVFGNVRGGAIYAEFADVTISNCRFENNQVRMTDFDSNAIGGAVAGYFSALDIQGCDFTGNASDLNGGAVYSYLGGMLRIADCTFTDNESDMYGGGVGLARTDFEITNCTFRRNYAGFLGAGIHSIGEAEGPNGPTGLIENCMFRRNSASYAGFGMGGGLATENVQNVTIADSSFEDNYGYLSGAIAAGVGMPPDGFVEIRDNEFCGNALNTMYGNIVDAGGNNEEDSCFCSPDINDDGSVNSGDLGRVLADWNSFQPQSDINNDGYVDGVDLAMVLVAWERNCGND